MASGRFHAPAPLPFDHPPRGRRLWIVLGATAVALTGVVFAARRAPRPQAASTPTSVATDEPAAEETEQIATHDVVAHEPTIKDAEPQETDDDEALPGPGESGISAPFEGPAQNGVIGIGGGAGGAFAGRAGGVIARGVGNLPILPDVPFEGLSAESYAAVDESGFLLAARAPLSTFSIDVDTASYANARRMLNDGQRPPAAAVRVEEMVNYFPYAYAPPAGNAPFAVHAEVAACPWRLDHRLVKIALKARDVERRQRPPMNLVFLLDVSGSIGETRKLPLVQASMRMLLEELAERDSVAIVTYAGAAGLRLPPTTCEKKDVIQAAIDSLTAGGSTNGAGGIQLAYDTAALRFSKDSANRVVLCTDGDFNVGVTSHEQLLSLITERAKSGIFLTVLGYGMGNLKDDTLELLADKGNGGYGYVDSTREAHKILVEQASGTLVTVAKDVKIQVEFNPATVAGYRLVGYENRRLAAKDFKDDTKDAGEMGAGHTVTALYEVVPAGGSVSAADPEGEPLKYQRPVEPPRLVPTGSAELLTVKLRWKEPQGAVSTESQVALTDAGAAYATASPDFKFAAAVAAFALLLRDSTQRGTASYDAVAEWAGEGLSPDPGGWRHEFLDLVARAKSLSASR